MALKSGERWTGGAVGFIGVGNMGRPMVAHLLASGVPVIVNDLDPVRVSPLLKCGARSANTVSEIVNQCDVVLLSLSSQSAVDSVVMQALSLPRTGVTIVDMSTGDPEHSAILNEKAKAVGMRMVDAPVSGGEKRAKNGTLSIMVGGEASAVEASLPVLHALGDPVVHIGGPGTGHVVKIVNNMVMLSNQLVLSEAILLAESAGISASTVMEAMAAGSGRSYALERTAPRILVGNFKAGGSLTIALKDISLANELSRRVNVPLRVSAETEKVLQQAIKSGLGDLDTSAMYLAIKGSHDDQRI